MAGQNPNQIGVRPITNRNETDLDHSQSEEHFIMLGMSGGWRGLVVVRYERGDGNVIRVISAGLSGLAN